jgi:hypothetical protein
VTITDPYLAFEDLLLMRAVDSTILSMATPGATVGDPELVRLPIRSSSTFSWSSPSRPSWKP